MSPAPRHLSVLETTKDPGFWRSGASGKLSLLRDRATGRFAHPFENTDTEAGDYEPAEVSGRGKVFTYTVNHHAYNPAVPPPYVIAIVELEEQADLRIATNIVNCPLDEVHVGMPVRVLFEQHGEAFVPVFEPDR